MADGEDQNPLEGMFPNADNPEYHKKKAEHEEKLSSEAGAAALEQHGYLADRVQRVRKNPPQAAAPTPPSRPEHRPPEEPVEGTGLQVDPSLATRHPQEPEAPVPEPAPQAPVAPAPVQAPVMQQVTSEPKIDIVHNSKHPLLAKLREDFGIDQIPFEDIEINDHIFKMRVLDTASVTSALRFADTLSMTARENTINLQIALVSFAVLAVDEIPVWKVFEVPLGADEKVIVEGKERSVFDPMSPPVRIRTIAATSFMDFLNTTATASLSEELWKAYNQKVDPKGSLQGLMNRSDPDREAEEVPLP